MATQRGSFEDALPALIEAAEKAVKQGAEDIMAVADVLVPKDTLTLLNSRFIDPVFNDGVSIRVAFGYGRGEELNPKDGKPAGAYAVPVHEILEARHMPPTQAKYLETPAVAYEAVAEEKMALEIRGYLGERLR